MIIYRPRSGSLEEAMKRAKEFETIEDMKKYIVKEHTDESFGEMISYQDISLDDMAVNDDRIGWRDTRYVLANRYGSENFIEKYGCSQCIGFCASNYKTNHLPQSRHS